MSRELILLSPHRLGTKYLQHLNAEEMAAYLFGYLALWHPALLAQAASPPRIAPAYDHEQPTAGAIYAVPEAPPSFLPEDWRHRAKELGAVAFTATGDRGETLELARQAVEAPESGIEPEPFYAVGLGYLVLDCLCEAMDHLNTLDADGFWADIKQALANPNDVSTPLAAAANRLREVREMLYSAPIYQLDFVVIEDAGQPEPWALALESPWNLLAGSAHLQAWYGGQPERLSKLRKERGLGRLDVGVSTPTGRLSAFAPVTQQLADLQNALAQYAADFGDAPAYFGPTSGGVTPHFPQLVRAGGLTHAVLVALEARAIPGATSAWVDWPTRDGSRINAFLRKAEPTADVSTYFHLPYRLYQTIMQDATAVMPFLSRSAAASSLHRDWLRLHRFGPVFGPVVTLSQFADAVTATEQYEPFQADDFGADELETATDHQEPDPVSRHVHVAERAHESVAHQALLGMGRGLMRPTGGVLDAAVAKADAAAVSAMLAERLVARASTATPGFIVLNPTLHTRRLAVALPGVTTPLPPPARATDLAGSEPRAVVEVPGLGFAWLPRQMAPGAKFLQPKVPLATESVVRNEFIEIEIDPATGGVRSVRDAQRKIGRLGQQLVYQPGSTMRGLGTKVVSTGPVAGCLQTWGELLDSHQQVLARFQQTVRVTWGCPVAELSIELEPGELPVGYGWHAYYGARFAWRSPSIAVYRGIDGAAHFTMLNRPTTSEFLELRDGATRTCILTNGLPFHQRQGARMLDVVLLPPGESATRFTLGLAVDLEDPAHAVDAWRQPAFVIPVDRGPPPVGPSGWLFAIDAPNIRLVGLTAAPPPRDGVILHLMETEGVHMQAELRCPRDPVRAELVDLMDRPTSSLNVYGDALRLSFGPNEWQRIHIDFA
jgi:hypothetical protein